MADGSVVKRVIDELRSDILTGVIAPDTRLSQVRLAETYGVSRVPVRDALQTLAGEGLLRHSTGTTAVVRGISVEELQELYEMREAIEPIATRLAVPNVGRVEVLKMRSLLDLMSCTTEPAVWLPANAEFHGTVYKRAPRPRMVVLVEQLRKLTDRYLHVHLKEIGNIEHLDEEHMSIYRAVERGDAAQAMELTRLHLETSHDFILQYLLEKEVADETDVRPTASTR